MKYFKTLAILLLSSVLFFYGCNDKSKTTKKDKAKPVEVSNTTKPENLTTTKEPAQNATGVWHYTCRLGCAGGAGAAVKCKSCGNVLAHNTEYHSKTNSNLDTSPFANPPATKSTTTPEPAQNAAGVWHYTCANGHPGGAGSAVACKTCSTKLTHNTAYH
ncbi:hypothetical protein [Psychroserpens sp. SPM9]|uniref:hypothetical protein n=1 Tax=Psychroserpens sp. SPM9 TaxID=2975598 RepID=UPI0021A7313E|nr:hypothetical protein [Psychroserpens sp. SPM9]MDG5490704.1 hypothetical protein [Psychroserpens sp. SPM9]